jgi:hypothetical protein
MQTKAVRPEVNGGKHGAALLQMREKPVIVKNDCDALMTLAGALLFS